MPTKKGALQLAEDFCVHQGTRVRTYAMLNEAHKQYLTTAPDYEFEAYQQAVATATTRFNDISSRVIATRREMDDPELLKLVDQVLYTRTHINVKAEC